MSVIASRSLEGSVSSRSVAAGNIFVGQLVGPPGPPGPAGPQGDDYVITEADKLEIASMVMDTGELQELRQNVAYLMHTHIEITAIDNSVKVWEVGRFLDNVTVTWGLNTEPVRQSISYKTLNGLDNTSESLTSVDVDNSLREKKIIFNWKPETFRQIKDHQFTLNVTDEMGCIVTKATTVSILNGVYYGAAAIPKTLDNEFILGLRSPVLTSTRARAITVNAAAGQYIWYALPTRLGECTFTVGGFAGGFTLVDTIEFTNASGYTENYYIYRSSNVVPGSTKVVIS